MFTARRKFRLWSKKSSNLAQLWLDGSIFTVDQIFGLEFGAINLWCSKVCLLTFFFAALFWDLICRLVEYGDPVINWNCENWMIYVFGIFCESIGNGKQI